MPPIDANSKPRLTAHSTTAIDSTTSADEAAGDLHAEHDRADPEQERELRACRSRSTARASRAATFQRGTGAASSRRHVPVRRSLANDSATVSAMKKPNSTALPGTVTWKPEMSSSGLSRPGGD